MDQRKGDRLTVGGGKLNIVFGEGRRVEIVAEGERDGAHRIVDLAGGDHGEDGGAGFVDGKLAHVVNRHRVGVQVLDVGNGDRIEAVGGQIRQRQFKRAVVNRARPRLG